MPLNLARVFSDDSRGSVLASLTGVGFPFNGDTCTIKLVQSITVNADSRSVDDIVYGIEGMGTTKHPDPFTNPVTSEAEKVYIVSDILTWTLTAPTGPQTIIGIVVGDGSSGGSFMAYSEFETPITVDEDGEVIKLALEIGFDGNDLYFQPRLLALGA